MYLGYPCLRREGLVDRGEDGTSGCSLSGANWLSDPQVDLNDEASSRQQYSPPKEHLIRFSLSPLTGRNPYVESSSGIEQPRILNK